MISYIKIAKISDMNVKAAGFLKTIYYKFLCLFNKVDRIRKEDRLILYIYTKKRLNIKKIEKILVKEKCKELILEENIKEKSAIEQEFAKDNFIVYNGKRIYLYSMTQILEYICKRKKIILENQSITLLANELTRANK